MSGDMPVLPPGVHPVPGIEQEYALPPKIRPDEPIPTWWVCAAWRVWAWLTWPSQVRQLKREGWRRTGWGKWESP